MFDDTFEKTLKISIHALLAESDPFRLLESQNAPIFLSTLSLRRATKEDINMARPKLPFLSTLSLRRATFKILGAIRATEHFYPRSPCGERQSLWPSY